MPCRYHADAVAPPPERRPQVPIHVLFNAPSLRQQSPAAILHERRPRRDKRPAFPLQSGLFPRNPLAPGNALWQ